jgi:membrane protease YdiL (CAAX protease family)
MRFTRRDVRDFMELAVGYGLILLALWSPLPRQRWIDLIALVWVLLVTAVSFDGLKANGLRECGFLRSLWVVGVALLMAAAGIALAAKLGTLRGPRSVGFFVQRYWAYAIWACLQEFLLLDFFLRRLIRLLRGTIAAIAVTTVLFTMAHLPNPILMPLTLVWAVIACLLFLRYRNLYTLGIAHAVLGVCIAITVPGQADHNMRVGLGYLTYRPHHHRPHYRNQSPQTVSTAAWVMADAPTRRR